MAERVLGEVIDRMVEVILADIAEKAATKAPDLDEDGGDARAQLACSLRRVATSSSFGAPEIQRQFWFETRDLLVGLFPNPGLSPLGEKLCAIFSGKE